MKLIWVNLPLDPVPIRELSRFDRLILSATVFFTNGTGNKRIWTDYIPQYGMFRGLINPI
jgi:hypothetical protein